MPSAGFEHAIPAIVRLQPCSLACRATMPSAGFEHAIPAIVRLQPCSLDCRATGIGEISGTVPEFLC